MTNPVDDKSYAEGHAKTPKNASTSSAGATASMECPGLPPLTSNTIMVDNADATAREAKTFAEVRSLLQVPSFDDLPWLISSENGMPGDGSDQTSAMQALVNSLPPEGGGILVRGDIAVSNINLFGRRNILFRGIGGNGAGAQQRARLIALSGVGAGRVIDARDTVNVSFEKLFLHAPNTAFDGTLLDYGVQTSGCSAVRVSDCLVYVNGAAGKGMSLHGTAVANVDFTTFSGKGQLVALQNTTGTLYANVLNFRSCNFLPHDQYPVVGSFEALTFTSCNFQAGDDGKGRAIQANIYVPMKGLNLIGCGMYDVTSGSTEWIQIAIGQAITVIGCVVGGAADRTTYFMGLGGIAGTDPNNSGVRGVTVIGNSFSYLAAALAFYGTNVDGSHVRGVVTGANSNIDAPMYSSLSLASNVINLGNNIYDVVDTSGDFAAGFSVSGLPTSATGLNTGRVWSDGGTLKIVS